MLMDLLHGFEVLSTTEETLFNSRNVSRLVQNNWVFIPPYASSQGGSWEIMVELFKRALESAAGEARRKPSLIELQTFTSDAVRIVNDRPLTTLSSRPNDLMPITPSSFLGQGLAPNTPLSTFHDRGDLRRDFTYNATLAHKFWLSWVKGYLPTLQGRGKWRVTRENLAPGQLVLVGDASDFSKRGAYTVDWGESMQYTRR